MEKKKSKNTTVQIAKVMRDLLKKVARKNRRSMTKELECLVIDESRRLQIEVSKDIENG